MLRRKTPRHGRNHPITDFYFEDEALAEVLGAEVDEVFGGEAEPEDVELEVDVAVAVADG